MTKGEGPALEQIVQQVKAELNPDGAGYHTSEAADLVFAKAREGCGFLNAAMRDLGRRGALTALKEYAAEQQVVGRKLTKVRDAVLSGQQDFADLSEGFGWIDGETALDEGVHAIRKVYRDLTYSEAIRVVDLKRKKARESDAAADLLQQIIDRNPGWRTRPGRTMGQVLGLD
jgi:hypothetical protein